jgi:hypothetical protein
MTVDKEERKPAKGTAGEQKQRSSQARVQLPFVAWREAYGLLTCLVYPSMIILSLSRNQLSKWCLHEFDEMMSLFYLSTLSDLLFDEVLFV